ncbi:ABC transporter permease [Lachnobacterium bovis]|uniref:ABC transporter permease n=1 Tax=Lachnobacterium bovis TaxID=140626 RepID=UPI00048E229F|nr:ABC transporter permease [Lachnobacterium bovis]
MMLFKLSYKNIKAGIKDYAVYFITLALGVAMFYLFNSIESQSVIVSMKKDQNDLVEIAVQVINIISYVISIIFGCLIIYASRFLIKRRKNEFGIYLTLGMSKKQVSYILLGENFLIGLFSLGVGLIIGICGSYFVSGLVANLFEADMRRFYFVISGKAIIKTIVCFGIIFVVDIIFHMFQVGRYKLIDLLYANRKMESIKIRRIWPSVIVFILSIVVLASAYHLALVDCFTDSITTNMQLKLLMAIILGCLGTLLFFWSVSGFALRILRYKSKVYYKELNIFTYRQLGYQINTNVIAMSIICILLFVTLCICAAGFSIKEDLTNKTKKSIPYDVEIQKTVCQKNYQVLNETMDRALGYEKQDKEKLKDISLNRMKLKKALNKLDGTYLSNFKDYTVIKPMIWYGEKNPLQKETKNISQFTANEADETKSPKYSFPIFNRIYKQSDFNKIAMISKKNTVSLKENEYAVYYNCELDTLQNIVEDEIKLTDINICGIDIVPKYKKIKKATLSVDNSGMNACASIVVTDEMYNKMYNILSKRYYDYMEQSITKINSMKTLDEKTNYYDKLSSSDNPGYEVIQNRGMANYEVLIGNYKAKSSNVRRQVDKNIKHDIVNSKDYVGKIEIIGSKSEMIDASVGVGAITVFTGLYLGGGCLIVCVALLALKELTNNVDSIEKYEVIRKIGADEKMINKSLFKQGVIFFMIPLAVALVHCIFGLQFTEKILLFSDAKLNAVTVFVAFVCIIAIYVAYFVVTYLNSRRIINRK